MAESSPLAHSPTLVSTPGAGTEEIAVGTTVGEFVVDRFLGAGAMGEVYAGTHPVIGKRVAIKVLTREACASPDGAERFKREAQAVNQIDHPNVIDIFSFGRLGDGRLYLVMDLVEGRSLRKALVEGPLEVATALEVLAAIADALDAAHARGVIHRDLKPDNVMLGGGTPPTVHVLDFGLAKLLAPGEAGALAGQGALLTGQGTWLGTPGYMAPEQWSADGAGPASDRYSLGVVAFELLSGSLPFQATSLPQMMEQHFRAKVPALSSRGAIPACSRFDPVLARAMAKEPEDRFGTARDMVEALRAVAGTSARPRSRPPAMRRSWVPAIAGASVLGLSIVAVLAVRGTRAPGAGDVRPVASAAGMVAVELATVPAGATVRRGGQTIGITPARLELAPATELVVELTRPGYQPVQHAMTVPDRPVTVPPFVLVEIDGFEGVWALPGGELRAFTRAGDRVEVSKLASADGEREFFRHYRIVSSATGVEFASTESRPIEPAAPTAPSCNVPHDTIYHYDPVTDALSVRLQRVRHELIGGACVIKASTFDPALVLVRADRRSSLERESLAPVGRPTNVFDPKEAAQQKKQPLVRENAPPTKRRPPRSKQPPAEVRKDRTPAARKNAALPIAPQAPQVQQRTK